MKFRTAVRRSTVILFILAASVFLGYAYQIFGDYLEKRDNPRTYADYVSRYCEEYGLPEYMVYGVMAVESGFRRDELSNDDRIGLMQIGPETLEWLNSALKTSYTDRDLYDPETSIRCGAYYLAYLYSLYGRWTPVLAAYETNVDDVTFWSLDEAYTDANGNLTKTPREDLNEKIRNIEKKADVYRSLYY